MKLTNKIESLYGYCEQHERFLASKTMVNKLYAAKIERLRSGSSNYTESKSDLEAEIEALKYQLEHHPQLIKVTAECEELKG